mgnify:CR=1 FL=1
MAIDKTRRDINRRELEFGNNQIDKALPEYFQEEYPKLVKLLDTYYEHLDSDGNFGFKIKDLPSSRDIAQTAKENLTLLEDELLLGGNYLEGILDKRTGAELANNYYRTKGTKYSFERFFRSFFKEDPEVIYGRDLIFNLNDGPNGSVLGPDTENRIQNDKVFQHWGLLFKLGIQQNEWKDLYELFAHPAGMYYASEVKIVSVNADISFDNMPIFIADVPAPVVYLGIGSMAPASLTEPTGIIHADYVQGIVSAGTIASTGVNHILNQNYGTSGGSGSGFIIKSLSTGGLTSFEIVAGGSGYKAGEQVKTLNGSNFATINITGVDTTGTVSKRLDLDRMTLSAHTLVTQDSTGFGSLAFNAEQYPSLFDMVRATSPTMDMDSDGTALKTSISLDNTIETLDQEKFKDSAV